MNSGIPKDSVCKVCIFFVQPHPHLLFFEAARVVSCLILRWFRIVLTKLRPLQVLFGREGR